MSLEKPVSLEKGPQKASPVAGELLTADDCWEKEIFSLEGCSLIGCLRSSDWAHTQGHMGSANGTRWAMRERRREQMCGWSPMRYIAQLRAA